MLNFYIYFIFVLCFFTIPLFLSLKEILKNNRARRVLINSNEYTDMNRKIFPMDLSINYNFYGKFEGFENDDVIWLESKDMTIKVKLKKTKVFYIPVIKKDQEKRSMFFFPKVDIAYKPLRWSSLSFLTSGAKFLLCGNFKEENGIFVFDGSDINNVVIIYDGSDDYIKQRALSQIREKFVYFRGFPLMSIIFGILLILGSLFVYKVDSESLKRVVLTAISPMLIFLPPGFFLFYFIYWIKSKQKKKYSEINLALYNKNISLSEYKTQSKKMFLSELSIFVIYLVILITNSLLVKLFF